MSSKMYQTSDELQRIRDLERLAERFYRREKLAWIIAGIVCTFSLIALVSVIGFYFLYNPAVQDVDEAVSTTGMSSTDVETTSSMDTTTYHNKVSVISRNDWNAAAPKSTQIPLLNIPIKRIIIGHTGGNFCANQTACRATIKDLQFKDPKLDDIPYNFLIGGDGNVYEGRGFYYEGQHTRSTDASEYDSIGICIAFIGNYQTNPPNVQQIEVLKSFIGHFVELRLIAENHIIVSQDDLKYFTIKALALNEAVKSLPNYYELYKIHRREEWNAQPPRELTKKFNRIMDWILIGHTVTSQCSNFPTCAAVVRSLQDVSFSNGHYDIFYNFIVGGDGQVFEGRGWETIGAHARDFNDKSIGFGVIGDFTFNPPNDAILNAMLKVFDDAMALGKLTNDYKIFGRADFNGPGPGEAFMRIIRGWCRYGNRTNAC